MYTLGILLLGFGIGFIAGHIYGIAWATQELMRRKYGQQHLHRQQDHPQAV